MSAKNNTQGLTAWKTAKHILFEQNGLTEHLFRKYKPIWEERDWLRKLPNSNRYGFANVSKIEEFLKAA